MNDQANKPWMFEHFPAKKGMAWFLSLGVRGPKDVQGPTRGSHAMESWHSELYVPLLPFMP